MIRRSRPGDMEAMLAVHRAAFPTEEEAGIVERLHGSGAARVSLVDEEGGAIIAHVVCSPVAIEGASAKRWLGLGPIAVHPDHQGNKVGSRLMAAALQACGQLGAPAVVLVGDLGYYGRFGFVAAERLGLRMPVDELTERLGVAILEPKRASGVEGTVRYHEAFGV